MPKRMYMKSLYHYKLTKESIVESIQNYLKNGPCDNYGCMHAVAVVASDPKVIVSAAVGYSYATINKRGATQEYRVPNDSRLGAELFDDLAKKNKLNTKEGLDQLSALCGDYFLLPRSKPAPKGTYAGKPGDRKSGKVRVTRLGERKEAMKKWAKSA